ncbi:hypothetical protein GCM10023196_050110 [Actinoallomurus vinaceus]|uniref:Uncharacterized protein n=1 Tax=Actinoallomurus vinaceus TaxID=1080074 RepID=A0ABP8UDA9_9ACTN
MRHEDEPLLYVLDYPGFRTEARVDDLQLDQYGVRVRNLLRHPLPRAVDATAYASRIIAGVSPGEGPVAAVAAYCTSASFAFEVASATARSQQKPPVIILFNAEAGTPEMILDSYRTALSGIGARSPEQDLSSRADMSLLSEDPERFVDALVQNVERAVVATLRTAGSSEEEATESARHMANTYADWLSHLVAACHSSVCSWSGNVVNITSADGPQKEFAFESDTVRNVRMACDRAQLLRSEATRSVVLSAFEAHRTLS